MLMDSERFSTTHQIAQVAMMVGGDLDHFVEGEQKIPKLLQIAAAG